MMMHHHDQTNATASHPIDSRSPTATPSPLHTLLPPQLSLGQRHPLPNQHVAGPLVPVTILHQTVDPLLARVRLPDIIPYDGAPSGTYARAVEVLSGSLLKYNAAVIELGPEDTSLMRCGLESSRLYFRTRAQSGTSYAKGGRGVYMYRAGRSLEGVDSSPPCMSDIFRCMGKTARAALSAIARHLRLRGDVFNHLLDDNPLPPSEASSSVLVATYSNTPGQMGGKGTIGGGKLATNSEVEKGLLTLISSDAPGLQVCDPNGRWYLADGLSGPGDLLLLTGKALSYATAGLRPSGWYRAAYDHFLPSFSGGRSSLAFRLMPQVNAVLDCTAVAAAGHNISHSYVPISVSQFLDDLSAEEDVIPTPHDNTSVAHNNLNSDPSLRSVLSDPLSGAFLEDAVFFSCGHSFGGVLLRRVVETGRCCLCNTVIDSSPLVPNHALRAAAAAVKHEDDRRLFHNASLRKRRKEMSDHRDNGDHLTENGLNRALQFPFSVNERVIIKGNKRTPDKFVGKEAIITSQCLNGWYLVKIVESGEDVRLQYRSLSKIYISRPVEESCSILQTVETSS